MNDLLDDFSDLTELDCANTPNRLRYDSERKVADEQCFADLSVLVDVLLDD